MCNMPVRALSTVYIFRWHDLSFLIREYIAEGVFSLEVEPPTMAS